jgi:ribonuclease R
LTINPRGFGFVGGMGTGEPDVYVPPERLGGALHGDTVVVRITKTSARGTEGEIVEVTRRAVTRVPGVLRRRGRSAWLEPDDPRMRGPITLSLAEVDDLARAEEGDAAVAQITRYPAVDGEHIQGKVIAVLGKPGEPKVEIEKILVREEIEEGFPAEAVAEARAYGDHITDEQREGREDLRDLPLCTIDPIDARDHDDAIYVRRATELDGPEAAYVAWIAIADVSAYVRPGTALDAVAHRRGCSVYLPDRAIPMLPRELSSHLCSLVPDEDRLCLAVEVVLDATATPLRHRNVAGVMRSRAKIAYEDAARALGFVTDETPPSKAALGLLADMKVAWELSSLLRARRMRRGALDFDLPEPKVKLDARGECIDVVRARANPGVKKAYSLIEELMLLCNEVVAEDLAGRTIPTVYRVHGVPDESRLDRFQSLAEALGVGFTMEDARDPKALGKVLKAVAKHPQAQVLNALLLRAMKQATYDVVNIGHFGLASKAYLHFTSPIRRYPDIVVHRAVKRLARGESLDRDAAATEALRESALNASTAERKAMGVEREVVDLHRTILMRKHIDDIFEGTVTSLVGSGVFVSIDEPFVDVLVRFDGLGGQAEDWELDEDGVSAIAKRSGDVIRLGDRMVVRIVDANIQRRTTYATRAASASPMDRESRHDGDGERPRARKGSYGKQKPKAAKTKAGKSTKSAASARTSRPERGAKGKKKEKPKRGSRH